MFKYFREPLYVASHRQKGKPGGGWGQGRGRGRDWG